ncbi:hypothetical protein D3C85_1859620 [compost metagenome]
MERQTPEGAAPHTWELSPPLMDDEALMALMPAEAWEASIVAAALAKSAFD